LGVTAVKPEKSICQGDENKKGYVQDQTPEMVKLKTASLVTGDKGAEF
jgi:hypothetical protein